jgi:hypothetical protein
VQIRWFFSSLWFEGVPFTYSARINMLQPLIVQYALRNGLELWTFRDFSTCARLVEHDLCGFGPGLSSLRLADWNDLYKPEQVMKSTVQNY